jgi:hypothetical protein
LNGKGTPVWDVDINEVNQGDVKARWPNKATREAVLSLSLQYDSGIVYGQLRGTIDSGGKLKPFLDEFNFERHPRECNDNTKDWAYRNAATAGGRAYFGWTGTSFNIYFKPGSLQLSDSMMKQLGLTKP